MYAENHVGLSIFGTFLDIRENAEWLRLIFGHRVSLVLMSSVISLYWLRN